MVNTSIATELSPKTYDIRNFRIRGEVVVEVFYPCNSIVDRREAGEG